MIALPYVPQWAILVAGLVLVNVDAFRREYRRLRRDRQREGRLEGLRDLDAKLRPRGFVIAEVQADRHGLLTHARWTSPIGEGSCEW